MAKKSNRKTPRFFYRAKNGRFISKGRWEGIQKRRSGKLARAVREIAKEEKKRLPIPIVDIKREIAKSEGYRVVQRGPVAIEVTGYFVTVNALVPGTWATSSSAVFEPDPESDQYHLVIWRTPVRPTVADALDGYDKLLDLQNLHADINESSFIVLSGELNRRYEDHSTSLMEVWNGPKPSRRLRTWANKTAKD